LPKTAGRKRRRKRGIKREKIRCTPKAKKTKKTSRESYAEPRGENNVYCLREKG